MRYLLCTLLALSLAAPPLAFGNDPLAGLELKALETEAEIRSLRVQQEILWQREEELKDAILREIAAQCGDRGCDSDATLAELAWPEATVAWIEQGINIKAKLQERWDALERRIEEKGAELIGLQKTLEAHRETQQAAPQPTNPGYMEQDHTFQ